MSAYYNENDPKAAATLRQLIEEGHIAPGDVDERNIEDVQPADLTGYTQVHLFAGFGLWSYAFRLAGWPDSRPAWSASCPCQPFSAAGQGAGFADERHLWPSAFHLIQHAKSGDVSIYGEQVAGARVGAWLDLVWSDLEGIGHTFRPTVLASAGFGAPIIRQRTYWVASATIERHKRRRAGEEGFGETEAKWGGSEFEPERLRDVGGLECSSGNGRIERGTESGRRSTSGRRGDGRLASTDGRHPGDNELQRSGEQRLEPEDGSSLLCGDSGAQSDATSYWNGPSPTNSFWRHADWLRCRDDKWRPVEPGTFPLAHGYPERVGLLRGAGNAISPIVAAHFIQATL